MGGGTTSTQQQTQKTKQKSKQKVGPYSPTQPLLNEILGASAEIPGRADVTPSPLQEWSVGGLEQNARMGAEQFNPQQTDLINDLYAGGGIGRGDQYLTQAGDTLGNYMGANYLDPNTNPYLQPALKGLQSDIYDDTANRFQLAGRSFSGDFADALGRGYAQGLNPLLLGQYNQNVAAQQGAASQMPGLASGLDASAKGQLSARTGAQTQVGALNQPYLAGLGAAETRAGLPYTNIMAQRNFLLPIAGLGSTSKGQSSGTMTGTSTMTQATDPFQTMAGLGLGGVGLLGGTGAFGTGGWLNFG